MTAVRIFLNKPHKLDMTSDGRGVMSFEPGFFYMLDEDLAAMLCQPPPGGEPKAVFDSIPDVTDPAEIARVRARCTPPVVQPAIVPPQPSPAVIKAQALLTSAELAASVAPPEPPPPSPEDIEQQRLLALKEQGGKS